MNKLKVAKISLVAIVIVALVASNFAVYNYAANLGYNSAVMSLADALRQAGATVNITDLGDGRYELHVHFLTATGQAGMLNVPFELHMTVEQWRNGELVSRTYHPMSLTTLGKNWIADKLSGASGTYFAYNATYISCSNSSSSFSAAWTNIPSEITTDGLARATGAITDTGDGTWNCTKTFSVTGTNSTKLYGYSYASSGGLIAAEQQGVGSQKNLVSGDTLRLRHFISVERGKITIQGSIS